MATFWLIFPARQKEKTLIKPPIEEASLLVPKAKFTGNPRASNAGVEIKPPPPTVESINAAINPANNKKAIVLDLKFPKFSPHPSPSLKFIFKIKTYATLITGKNHFFLFNHITDSIRMSWKQWRMLQIHWTPCKVTSLQSVNGSNDKASIFSGLKGLKIKLSSFWSSNKISCSSAITTCTSRWIL